MLECNLNFKIKVPKNLMLLNLNSEKLVYLLIHLLSVQYDDLSYDSI
ncbi:hypothetical protein EZS27_005968 [termite gut metagenome]|uniref:Uncharacterized protein n=1 Tax=termite gut metagenome TaxID=433724 RepID=A0A5J4SJV9_9ZZZZ